MKGLVFVSTCTDNSFIRKEEIFQNISLLKYVLIKVIKIASCRDNVQYPVFFTGCGQVKLMTCYVVIWNFYIYATCIKTAYQKPTILEDILHVSANSFFKKIIVAKPFIWKKEIVVLQVKLKLLCSSTLFETKARSQKTT